MRTIIYLLFSFINSFDKFYNLYINIDQVTILNLSISDFCF